MKIEKNVPVNKANRDGSANLARQMEVGDSILLNNRNQCGYILSVLLKDGKKGISRQVEGGFRVWRTK